MLSTRDELATEWRHVLVVEGHAASGDTDARDLLRAIAFLDHAFVRLGFYLILRDELLHPDTVGKQVLLMAQSCSEHLQDEKSCEDLHGFIRDLGRSKLSRGVGVSACFAACRNSGVIEARGIKTPEV